MKKFVSLKVQRILMFLPFFNCFVLFIWLYNYGRSSLPLKVFIKSLVVLFAFILLWAVINILLSRLFVGNEVIDLISTVLSLYVTPFSMAFGLIGYQKKVLPFEE